MQRKLPLSGGATLQREIAAMRATIAEVAGVGRARIRRDRRAARRGGRRAGSGERLSGAARSAPTCAAALAGATPYLRLFGLALGGACLAQRRARARDARGDPERGRIGLARFFAEKLATAAPGLARAIVSGAGALCRHCEAILAEAA